MSKRWQKYLTPCGSSYEGRRPKPTSTTVSNANCCPYIRHWGDKIRSTFPNMVECRCGSAVALIGELIISTGDWDWEIVSAISSKYKQVVSECHASTTKYGRYREYLYRVRRSSIPFLYQASTIMWGQAQSETRWYNQRGYAQCPLFVWSSFYKRHKTELWNRDHEKLNIKTRQDLLH
jgi:hypothetical protein